MEQGPQKITDPTRERLLDEAERLFALKGYDAVSLREITAAAGTHLAAVNYHFGSKKNLYLQMFRQRWLERAHKIQQPLRELEKREHLTVEELVRTLTRSFLQGSLSSEERQRHAQLIAREMDQNSEVLHLLAQEAMRPFMDLSLRLWQRCLPDGMEPERLRLVVLSIFSQILYFNFARPVVQMVTGREYDEKFVNQLVEHITSLALCGINGDSKQ